MIPEAVSRRRFLQFTAAGAGGFLARSTFGQTPPMEPKLVWHDVRDWGVEGKGWTDTAKYFDRLPARAEGKVPAPVWNLSRNSAGMLVHFRTASPQIWTEHVVTSPTLALPNMTAIGASGLDLYAADAEGNWKWLSVTRPAKREMKDQIISGLPAVERSYQLYLPLYNGTESLKIGVPEGEVLTPVAPRTEKPLLFYGTSITHGASASRPGMPHPAILGRRLNLPVINLGFSGNGRMEKEVGEFLVELDPAVFVIDCLPNMQAREVQERAAPLVRQIRQARPETPIVLVEDRTYANTPFLPDRQRRHELSRQALQQALQELRAEGVAKLWYIEGDKLLGEDREDTTDGSHPSDLGFWRQANAFEPVLKAALAGG
ncbi:SGNH/GDSL hydrolase family protein [Planctomicrobium piriforme]|uniref:Lysophospholipase L1 n=1 Tax=Planctomicrobium piriforme TaxID=1576369 RepID=A0A1I3KA32_9PLAN|nr:SGNH/GDSL hydrolase family protein [Planctomicrobium piriforme]SFI69158.1 Lysophospholipase L1 [Planctomicrobium piriforme]